MVLRRVLFGVGWWLALECTPLWAQSQYARPLPLPNPAVSPYLNLLRSGNSPAFNYLTLVRPELDSQKNIDQLNTQLQRVGATQQAATIGQGEPTTGHTSGFMTHKRYFMTLGGGGAPARTGAPVANKTTK